MRRRPFPPRAAAGRCLHASAAASGRCLHASAAAGRCLRPLLPCAPAASWRASIRGPGGARRGPGGRCFHACRPLHGGRRGEALSARGEALAALLMAGVDLSWQRRFELAAVDLSWRRPRPALSKRRPAFAEVPEAGIDIGGGGRRRWRSSCTRERVERGGK
jgi:hypothetical protein